MYHTFVPKIKTLNQFDLNFSTEEIKNERMIFSGDLEFAYKNGGTITKGLIAHLTPKLYITEMYNVVIDTRVTMCMTGSYPSIPGWHCDDVPRTNGQPNLNLINRNVKHYMCLFSDKESHSCTEFVTEPLRFGFNDKSEIWTQLDKKVNSKPRKTRFIKTGELVQFDQNAIHRASPAQNNGWRYFFRLSVTHRKPANEIRNQVQVYIPLGRGW